MLFPAHSLHERTMDSPQPDKPRSLADIHADETVLIDHVLFDTLRELCADLGIEEGAEVRCRRSTSAVLLLENPQGRTVILDQDWARFIEVRETEACC